MTVAALILLAATAAPAATRAQGQVALYSVKPDHDGAFVEGYARHLGWHAANGDTWAWYVWGISTGERRGTYAGGSFGHAWEELERRPRPADDRADHERTIDVHLERSVSRMVESRPDLGGELPLLETAPSLAVFEVHVRPSARASFEDALVSLRASGPSRPHGWFEVVNGDRVPAYLLVVPLRGRPDLQHVRFERLGGLAEPVGAARSARDQALTAVESVRSEVWTFRPDISSCVLEQTRCVALAAKAP